MLARFLVYGALGWCFEIIFTGISALLFDRDRAATGKTYLWMFPVYGGTALLLEVLAPRLQLPWLARMWIYVLVIYAAEFLAGWLLRRTVGRCPWDYTGRGINLRGLVRLDYAPAWFVVAVLFEPLSRFVTELAGLPSVQALAGRLNFAG